MGCGEEERWCEGGEKRRFIFATQIKRWSCGVEAQVHEFKVLMLLCYLLRAPSICTQHILGRVDYLRSTSVQAQS